ncbi:hypothetical protein PIB30_109195, partial [Stylosanthes scabra]|nr:hypothetical protein [Stylosanthes scabra]
MESGELMLRIYDENLFLQVYKAMHQSPSDSKTCMKIEKGSSPSPVPPDKGSKKKSKEDKGQCVDPGESPHIPTTCYTPHPSVLVGNASKTSSKDASNHFFDPPREMFQCQANDDKQALGGRQPIQNILF